ncbi:MAG: WG repeat-containing protein, partial [Chitinophagaceae bacterium]
MKKFYFLSLIFFISKALHSQVTIKAIELPDSRYQFVDSKTGAKINDLLWEETESFVNGFAKVATGHKWGFVDRHGNPVIKADYESARNFVNKLAAVKQNSKWGFIDEKGTLVIP